MKKALQDVLPVRVLVEGPTPAGRFSMKAPGETITCLTGALPLSMG
jgi:hypothetical protein